MTRIKSLRGIEKEILLILIFIFFSIIPQALAPPPTPHSVAGFIHNADGTQVPLGTIFLVNDTNTSNFIQSVTSVPVPGFSGRYSVTISSEDGDYVYTMSWNDTHFGRNDFVIIGDMDNINVTLNISRIEQNLTIIIPEDSDRRTVGTPFNVSANITTLGGSDHTGCNATISISNPSVLSLAAGETALHQGLSFTLGNTVNESWELNATAEGFSNISVGVVCENQTYFTNDNNDTVFNIQFTSNYPQIASVELEDNVSAPINEILLSPNETVKVWCNGTATDADGFPDLNLVQGILYANSSTLEAQDNRSVHYTDTNCNTATFNTDGAFSCEFDVYFYAQPVDWTCFVNVSDFKGSTNNSNDTSQVLELLAIDISPTVLDFGSLQRGYESGTNDFVLDVWNLGNVVFDIIVDTYNATPGSDQAMDCTTGQIPTTNIRFNETANVDYSVKVPVPPAGGLQVDFNHIPQRGSVAIQGTSKGSYWGIEIPSQGVDNGGIGGSCSGIIRYEAVSNS
jgi:hypothetical protein